ncbi:MAG: hypothetical protein M3550_02850 [Actinomycetota bacterium]|nr:hypothetical protein [Actinomycetota bacterium]
MHHGDVPHDEVGKPRATASTVRRHPGSTAGDVAKALDTVTGKCLVQMAKGGELKVAARRYKAD